MGLQTGCLAFPLSTQGGALNFPCLAERQVFTIWDNKEIDIQRDAGAGASHLVPNHPLPSRSVAFSFQALFFGGLLESRIEKPASALQPSLAQVQWKPPPTTSAP